ncbi:TGF-beta-activated kinase 1 and MAP3K7-binding protein 3 isoform X1 [Coregonus clupeaformis]|uniref:TGF-beta-activated kinase 1 and MAP3K7-binding protein 3 isoform X1 n=1 Tax=Coregonus clupeaformis TaxID=59861 RepID=UPI001BDFFC19|nr:TGF-beta-activated kinase 1 and MAP3K7-binding protein 3 isoform X1 [Coregonus clupeaformis]
MAQGGPQLDYHILQDLKQRFPEIPEGVVSQCLLQNNNNLDICCHLLAQESNRYLYGEFHNPEEVRLSRNHMLHIQLGGYPPSEAVKANGGGHSLVHSSSDGHIEPPRVAFPEPLSAPATIAPSPGYNPFFDHGGRTASTPTPPPMQGMSPTFSPIPRYTMNPITVTLSQNLPNAPQALQIPAGHYGNSGGNALYIRPSPSQSPQPSPWPSSGQPVYQPSPYTTPTYQSPYSSPQHQPHQVQPQQQVQHQVQHQPQHQPQHQQTHVFLPISPPTLASMPYHHHQQQQQQQQQPIYRPFLPKSSLKNQIEITLEGPRPRSNSPVHCPPGQTLYMATSPSPSSPQRGLSLSGGGLAAFHPGVYVHQCPTRPRPTSSPQPGSQAGYTFKIKVSPGQAQQQQRPPSGSPPVSSPPESLLNMVDQGEHHALAPAPILPISALPGNIISHIANLMPRRSSSGSDDYAYTQALLLHQRARMERLLKELLMERQKLEQLKADVNDMEYDALQRRFRRVNSTSLIPRPEEMTRLRSLNRQLQIDIDCTLKETDLLQSRGKFDPQAENNFYKNIQTGPVVPPKPARKEGERNPKPAVAGPQRDEDFEGAQWSCEECTFLNHPALNRCEQCEMPRYT